MAEKKQEKISIETTIAVQCKLEMQALQEANPKKWAYLSISKMYIIYILYCTFNRYGDFMNVDLGIPYETILKKAIEKGYAGNQTEVIRQALLNYERMIDEEEVKLVNKGIELEMQDIREGRVKTKSTNSIKKKYKL